MSASSNRFCLPLALPHLQLQVVSVVELDLGVLDLLLDLSERVGHVHAALGHAAEVHRQVGAGAGLVDRA